MINLVNIPEPDKYKIFYLMFKNEGHPTFLGRYGYSWYQNPTEAQIYYNLSAAKSARTRYRNKQIHYSEGTNVDWVKDIQIVEIVIDSYHLEEIC